MYPVEIKADALQNFRLSYFLATTGKYTVDGIKLEYRREPLPNILNAVYINMFTDLDRNADINKLATDENFILEFIRLNIFYLFLLYISICWISFLLLDSHWYSLITTGFVMLFFSFSWLTSTLYTDLLAAVFFALITGSAICWYKRPSIRNSLFIGVLFGLLALTKASFYYISILFILSLPIIGFLFQRLVFKQFLKGALFITTGLYIVTMPWMIRNYLVFSDFAIARRGGEVLLIRAVKNQMTSEEFKGAFYAYAPFQFRDAYLGKLLGFQPVDLEKGGRLQRLNRHLTEDNIALKQGNYDNFISYYHIGKNKIPSEMRAQFPGQTGTFYDEMLKKKSFALIKKNPANHLRSTLVFAWRGIWGCRESTLPGMLGSSLVIWNGIAFISFIALFVLSILKKQLPWIIFTLPAVLYFLFHAFFTHFIPRYSVPLIPIFSISMVILLVEIFKPVGKRLAAILSRNMVG